MKLWHKVTIGLIAGIIFGIYASDKVIYIKPIGDIFLNMIKMIIVPLIFFSLVSGITSISDPASLGRIGIKACLAYLLTTSFAILIGISIALLMKPGFGITLPISNNITSQPNFSFINMIVDIVPQNAIGALATGTNMLQVVFFAIFTGITLVKMGSSGKNLVNLSQTIAKFIFKMISIIIEFSPYGAFALTAWIVGTQGTEILYSLAKLICAIFTAMIVQYIFFGIFIKVFGKLSPYPFFRKSLEYQAVAFSTSSTKATLATTMRVCNERMGVSGSSTSFVLPLGAAMNMDGIAIYLSIAAIFFAQATGTTLELNDYLIIMITTTVGSIGGAGIPGASIIMLPMVLSAINLPIEGIALLVGIDRIIDMVRTTISITGDATVTLIIDKSEGNLNEETYYSK